MPNKQMLACAAVEALRLCGFRLTPACRNADALLAAPKELARFAFALSHAPRREGNRVTDAEDDKAYALVIKLLQVQRLDGDGDPYPKGKGYVPSQAYYRKSYRTTTSRDERRTLMGRS